MGNCCKDFDFGPEFDDFVRGAKETARDIGEKMREMGGGMPPFFGYNPFRPDPSRGPGPESRPDFGFRSHAYPPANIRKDAKGGLVLEFALAGVDESSVKIGFQGDYLVLSARFPAAAGDDARFERRSYRPRDVERQKYYVPAEDYDQAAAQAQLKAGLLTVTVPAKDIPEADAVRITIVKEGK